MSSKTVKCAEPAERVGSVAAMKSLDRGIAGKRRQRGQRGSAGAEWDVEDVKNALRLGQNRWKTGVQKSNCRWKTERIDYAVSWLSSTISILVKRQTANTAAGNKNNI